MILVLHFMSQFSKTKQSMWSYLLEHEKRETTRLFWPLHFVPHSIICCLNACADWWVITDLSEEPSRMTLSLSLFMSILSGNSSWPWGWFQLLFFGKLNDNYYCTINSCFSFNKTIIITNPFHIANVLFCIFKCIRE